MTRAYISLLQGNIAAAFYYHPLFILPPIALAVWLLHKKLPEKFIKIFKPDLKSIKVEKTINKDEYICELVF